MGKFKKVFNKIVLFFSTNSLVINWEVVGFTLMKVIELIVY